MSWTIRPSSGGIDIFDEESGQTICTVHHDPNNPNFALYRARLIAKGPELFNMLVDVMAHGERVFPQALDHVSIEYNQLMNAIRGE